MVPSLTSIAEKNKFCSILTFLENLNKKKKIKNVNLARLFARLKPAFLSKKRTSKARLLTKMSPSEELGKLMVANMVVDEVANRTNNNIFGKLRTAQYCKCCKEECEYTETLRRRARV